MLTLFAFHPLARMSIRLKHCSGIGVADIVLARDGVRMRLVACATFGQCLVKTSFLWHSA